MAIDLSLLAVPTEIENIFSRALEKENAEYPDLLFLLRKVFKSDFNDFDQSDRIEFKNDAQSLLLHYPNQSFLENYYYDSSRHYDVFDYLIAQYVNDESYAFFRDGKEFQESKGSQGHSLLYWNQEILKNKERLIKTIEFENLIKHYNFETMENLGVYKIHQINGHKATIKKLFNELQRFLTDAVELNGYVLVIRN